MAGAPRSLVSHGPLTYLRSFANTKCYIYIYIEREREKEGNVLFNDALNTFYLRLYGVGHGKGPLR